MILLAYALRPLAQAIIITAPLLPHPSVLWKSWARVIGKLLHDDDDSDDATTSVVQEFYHDVETVTDIRVYELGDAVTSMMKLLTVLRDDPVLGRLTEMTLYTGRSTFVMRGFKYDPTSKSIFRRTKWTNEKKLSVPFHVTCPSATATDKNHGSTSLEQALENSLSPRLVEGYKWSGNYEEDSVPVDETNVPSDDEKNEEWQTTRQLNIHALPPFWLIHVDHFSSIHGRVQSHQRSCSIPLRLDVAAICHLDHSANLAYRLVGAILHLSNPDASDEEEEDGHYVSVVKSDESSDDEWILVDDSSTTPVAEETCKNLLAGCETNLSENGTYMQACLLVYENTNATSILEPMIQDLLNQVEEAKLQGEAVVGRRLQVLWGRGKFYEGVVESFDHRTGKHTIRYNDGDVRSYTLSKKTIEWL